MIRKFIWIDEYPKLNKLVTRYFRAINIANNPFSFKSTARYKKHAAACRHYVHLEVRRIIGCGWEMRGAYMGKYTPSRLYILEEDE